MRNFNYQKIYYDYQIILIIINNHDSWELTLPNHDSCYEKTYHLSTHILSMLNHFHVNLVFNKIRLDLKSYLKYIN